MRTRTRNTIVANPSGTVFTGYGDTGDPEPHTARTISSGWSESFSDSDDQQFRMARKRGGFLVRPCEHLKVVRGNFVESQETGLDYVQSGGTVIRGTYILGTDVSALDLFWPTGWGFWENNPSAPSVANFYSDHPDPLGSVFRRNQVLGAAYAKAGQAEMQSLVTLAEFEKTLGSVQRLTTLLPRLIKWYRTHRHTIRVRGEVLRLTGDLARQWLEYRYGFMQLYYDYNSLCKAVQRKNGLYRICHSRWDGSQHEFATLFDHASWAPWSDWTGSKESTRSTTIRAGVIVKCDPASDFCRTWGLSSPLGTCWELVPFSFIVDWFIGVSDALAAFEGRMTQNVVASWVSEKNTIRLQWRTSNNVKTTPNGADFYVGWGGWRLRTQEDIEHYVRVANPRYYFSLPDFKIRLNWKRCLDASALLRQLRRDV